MEQNNDGSGRGESVSVICKSIKYKSPPESITGKILGLLPEIYTHAYNRLSNQDKDTLSEIRLRADMPSSFTVGRKNILVRNDSGDLVYSDITEISQIIGKACEGSVYSYTDTIREGYIPFHGTRIGVSGIGSIVDSRYVGQRKISSVVLRIPGYVKNAADTVLEQIKKEGLDSLMGILAVSPPNCGKTTFLRALAKGLSGTDENGLKKRVCIIDERRELFDKAMLQGCLCDVISGIPKIKALEMAIRTMSPEVIVFDEIGSAEQTELLCNAYCGGVYIAASVHGSDISEVMYGSGIKNAFAKGVFSSIYLMRENAKYRSGELVRMPKSELE